MSELSDVQIMQRVQAGQEDLFEVLVLRYRAALLNAAWSKLGDRAWAEDVVQEAFLAAFAARETYKPQFSFRTWMWTILLNLCRRQWKKRELQPREHSLASAAQAGERGWQELATRDTALAQLLRIERQELVHRVLARLPEPEADALRLRFFGGLPFQEIALAMSSSLGAAKQRVKRGLIRLAEEIRASGGGVL